MSGRARDDGSATLWVVAACVLVLVVGSVFGVRSVAVLARHRAEAAADLAALAAAGRIGIGGDPCAAARRIAGLNDARLAGCRVALAPDLRSGTVVVRVTAGVRLPVVGQQRVDASARAGRLPADVVEP